MTQKEWDNLKIGDRLYLKGRKAFYTIKELYKPGSLYRFNARVENGNGHETRGQNMNLWNCTIISIRERIKQLKEY